jgi:hypothetical protein
MSGILFTAGRFFATDSNGAPLVGGTVQSYAAGTSTPKSTYADAGLATPNANPLTLDGEGSASIFLGSGAYKIVVSNATGVVQYTTDNISGSDAYIQANPAADQTIATGKLNVTNGVNAAVGVDTPAAADVSALTVHSSTSLQRLVNVTGVGQMYSANLQGDGVTRDVAGRWGYGYAFDTVNGGVKVRCVNPAGTVKDYAPRFTVGADFTAHTNTGNTTVNSLIQRTILGNTLGTAGGIKLRLHMNVTQGAGTSSLFVFLGGIQIAAMAFTASTNGLYEYEVTFGNRGAANSQVCYAQPIYLGGSSATVLPGSRTTTAIDTTADCVLDIRVGNANNTDSITIDMFEAQVFSTFAM